MSFRVCYLSWKLNLSPSPGNVKSVTTLRDERFPIGFNRDDLLTLYGRRRGRKYLPIRSILRYNNDDKIGIRRYRILKNFEEEVERTRLSRIAEIDITISPSNEKFKSSKKF